MATAAASTLILWWNGLLPNWLHIFWPRLLPKPDGNCLRKFVNWNELVICFWSSWMCCVTTSNVSTVSSRPVWLAVRLEAMPCLLPPCFLWACSFDYLLISSLSSKNKSVADSNLLTTLFLVTKAFEVYIFLTFFLITNFSLFTLMFFAEHTAEQSLACLLPKS